MSRYILLVETGADIPKEIAEQYSIIQVPIRVSQWVSAAIVIAGIFLLSRIRCSKTSKKQFDFSDH